MNLSLIPSVYFLSSPTKFEPSSEQSSLTSCYEQRQGVDERIRIHRCCYFHMDSSQSQTGEYTITPCSLLSGKSDICWLARRPCVRRYILCLSIIKHRIQLVHCVWLFCFTLCPFWSRENSTANLLLWQSPIILNSATLSSSTVRNLEWVIDAPRLFHLVYYRIRAQLQFLPDVQFHLQCQGTELCDEVFLEYSMPPSSSFLLICMHTVLHVQYSIHGIAASSEKESISLECLCIPSFNYCPWEGFV